MNHSLGSSDVPTKQTTQAKWHSPKNKGKERHSTHDDLTDERIFCADGSRASADQLDLAQRVVADLGKLAERFFSAKWMAI